MLGVDPEAGIDQIRLRYRALARELHPDHRHGDPARSADRRSAEMARVNEAWAVLSDPDRRAAHDRELAGRSRQGYASPATSYGAERPPPLHQHPPPIGCLASVAGIVPWIALLVVLAAIFVFTAYAGSGRDDGDGTGGDAPMVTVRDLRGSCIQQAGGATIVVDCFTVPHEGVIVAQASTGAACPDGTVEWLIRHQEVLACTEPGTEVRATP
ncbi:MAG: J domain-containing protein [Acidimicrobiales bacterium]|nr:J domain-containing protein [Acidimicrobiales bacterium]